MPIIIKRQHALILGLATYFTGQPCKYGHIAERRATNWQCVVCYRAYYLATYRAKIVATTAKRSAERAERRANIKAELEQRHGRAIISRDEARQLNLTRYFTGRLCKYGHIAERRTYNAGCAQCIKERRTDKGTAACRRWRNKHREHYRQYQRTYQRKWQQRQKAKREKENGEP